MNGCGVFEPVADRNALAHVRIEMGTIASPNGRDMAPEPHTRRRLVTRLRSRIRAAIPTRRRAARGVSPLGTHFERAFAQASHPTRSSMSSPGWRAGNQNVLLSRPVEI